MYSESPSEKASLIYALYGLFGTLLAALATFCILPFLGLLSFVLFDRVCRSDQPDSSSFVFLLLLLADKTRNKIAFLMTYGPIIADSRDPDAVFFVQRTENRSPGFEGCDSHHIDQNGPCLGADRTLGCYGST